MIFYDSLRIDYIFQRGQETEDNRSRKLVHSFLLSADRTENFPVREIKVYNHSYNI